MFFILKVLMVGEIGNMNWIKMVVLLCVGVFVLVGCGSDDGLFSLIFILVKMVVCNVIFFFGDGMGMMMLMVVCIYGVGEDGVLMIDMLLEFVFVKIYLNDV